MRYSRSSLASSLRARIIDAIAAIARATILLPRARRSRPLGRGDAVNLDFKLISVERPDHCSEIAVSVRLAQLHPVTRITSARMRENPKCAARSLQGVLQKFENLFV